MLRYENEVSGRWFTKIFKKYTSKKASSERAESVIEFLSHMAWNG